MSCRHLTMLVGRHLGCLDRANARLANKALACALAAVTSKLSISVLAFQQGLPWSADSLAKAAPAAIHAVLYVDNEQEYWEDTFVDLFSVLAAKPCVHALTIVEYSSTLPLAWDAYEREDDDLCSSADYWSPHLHTLASKLKELHIETLQPLQLMHQRSLRHLTALTSLELLYPGRDSELGKHMPQLPVTLQILKTLTGLQSLKLGGKASHRNHGWEISNVLEDMMRQCRCLSQLQFAVQFYGRGVCSCPAPLLLPSLQKLTWDTNMALNFGQVQPDMFRCVHSLNIPQLNLEGWTALLALPHLFSSLTHLESTTFHIPDELLQIGQQQQQQQLGHERGPQLQVTCPLLKLAALKSLALRLAATTNVAALSLLPKLEALYLQFDGGMQQGQQAPWLDLSSLSKLQGLTSLRLDSISMAAQELKFTGAAISAAAAGMKQLAKLSVRGDISAWGSEHKLPVGLRDLDLQYGPAALGAQQQREPIQLWATVLPTSLHRLTIKAFGFTVNLIGEQHFPLLSDVHLAVHADSCKRVIMGCPTLQRLLLSPCQSAFDLSALPGLAPHLTQLGCIAPPPMLAGPGVIYTELAFEHAEAISQLTGLQSLRHYAVPFGEAISPDQLAALAHLTRLTWLELDAVKHWEVLQHCVEQMPALQVLKLARGVAPGAAPQLRECVPRVLVGHQ